MDRKRKGSLDGGILVEGRKGMIHAATDCPFEAWAIDHTSCNGRKAPSPMDFFPSSLERSQIASIRASRLTGTSNCVCSSFLSLFLFLQFFETFVDLSELIF